MDLNAPPSSLRIDTRGDQFTWPYGERVHVRAWGWLGSGYCWTAIVRALLLGWGQCWGVHVKQGGVSPGGQGRLSHTPSGPFSSWHRAPVSRHSALGSGLACSPKSQPRYAPRSATAKACEIRIGIARMYQPAGPPPLHRDRCNGARRADGEGAGCSSPKGIGWRNPRGPPSPGARSAPGSRRLQFSPLPREGHAQARLRFDGVMELDRN